MVEPSTRPRATLAMRAQAYSESDRADIAQRITPVADVTVEPVCLALMGGFAEIWLTVSLPEPIRETWSISASQAEVLSALFREFGRWCRDMTESRPNAPEVMAVRIEFTDLCIQFDCDATAETCMGSREVRAIPALLREAVPRLRDAARWGAVPLVGIGVRPDPACETGGQCVLARYWELGADGSEPTHLFDSWRGRLYAAADERA